MKKRIFLQLIMGLFIFLIANLGFSVNLINTQFETADGWVGHSTGTWTQVATDGTWSANGYANGPADTHSGSLKVGFNAAARYLIAPSKNKPGVLTFWTTKSSGTAAWTVDIQKRIDGGSWSTVSTITNANITYNTTPKDSYTQITVDINDPSNNVEIQWYMSARSAGSCYIDDVQLTEYEPPAAVNATISPSSQSFGPIAKNTTIDKIITVKADATNTGDVTISSPGLTITGTDAAKFSVVTSPILPKTLAADQTTTFTIRYTPGNVNNADHDATATLTSNDATNPFVLLNGKTFYEVADIYEAKGYASTSGTLIIAGTVTVTSKTNGLNGGRNQLYIQDASGPDGQTGILIDDADRKSVV